MLAAKTHYALRNRIERFFNRLKHSRRIATRYDNLASSFLGFVQLATIRQWIRFVHTPYIDHEPSKQDPILHDDQHAGNNRSDIHVVIGVNVHVGDGQHFGHRFTTATASQTALSCQSKAHGLPTGLPCIQLTGFPDVSMILVILARQMSRTTSATSVNCAVKGLVLRQTIPIVRVGRGSAS